MPIRRLSRRRTAPTEENGSEDEAGEEAQEGESASERPDSPDDLDEAAGETPEPEAPADS